MRGFWQVARSITAATSVAVQVLSSPFTAIAQTIPQTFPPLNESEKAAVIDVAKTKKHACFSRAGGGYFSAVYDAHITGPAIVETAVSDNRDGMFISYYVFDGVPTRSQLSPVNVMPGTIGGIRYLYERDAFTTAVPPTYLKSMRNASEAFFKQCTNIEHIFTPSGASPSQPSVTSPAYLRPPAPLQPVLPGERCISSGSVRYCEP
jgi:hypothetical protein